MSKTTPQFSFEEIQNLCRQYSDTNQFLQELQRRSQEMTRTPLVMLPVSDLRGKCYFVDNYQRGYKWTPDQVREMLDDIAEFESTDGAYYCLQPVVVRHLESKDEWELIDGQQRLTTIYMILKYLRQTSFSIRYETRASSAEFLRQIDQLDINQFPNWDLFVSGDNRDYDNVDNYHFYKAWMTIAEWFSKCNESQRNRWTKVFLERTKVIWYDVSMDTQHKLDSIQVFMRMNSGKIPLTNAELIKARLIGQQPNPGEFALAWDTMEQRLQQNPFWSFIYPGDIKKSPDTRIEYLFDIVANKSEKEQDPLYTYKAFTGETRQENWEMARRYFALLEEWYAIDDKYHLVGFLVSERICPLRVLVQDALKIDKLNLLTQMEGRIHQWLSNKDLKSLSYGEDNKTISTILLLFNIESLRQSLSPYRFPFHIYRTGNWSLEHIHARHSQDLSEATLADCWLAESLALLADFDDDESSRLRSDFNHWYAVRNKPEARDLLESLRNRMFVRFGDIEETDLHSISNLALLDRDHNSSLNNSVFPTKRKRIIELDREGKFIPIATKNIFAKHYSKHITHMNRWSAEDRSQYYAEIKRVLMKYLEEKSK